MALMESPKPYLRAIQREVSVVLRAAEDPAILTFKQVRLAVEKAVGLADGFLHTKEYKATIRETVHCVMDKIESENIASQSARAQTAPNYTASSTTSTSKNTSTSALENANRGQKGGTRSSNEIETDPDRAARGNTIPVRGARSDPASSPESEKWVGGKKIKLEKGIKGEPGIGKSKIKLEKGIRGEPRPEKGTTAVIGEQKTEKGSSSSEPEPERRTGESKHNVARGGSSSEPEPERRTEKSKHEPERGGSSRGGSRGGGSDGGGRSGDGGDGADREGSDGVVCVLSNTKTTKRQVIVKTWRGSAQVDIREHYKKDTGEFAPGNKGVLLNLSQWKTLKNSAETLDAMVDALT